MNRRNTHRMARATPITTAMSRISSTGPNVIFGLRSRGFVDQRSGSLARVKLIGEVGESLSLRGMLSLRFEVR